jgi:hypothetical protein
MPFVLRHLEGPVLRHLEGSKGRSRSPFETALRASSGQTGEKTGLPSLRPSGRRPLPVILRRRGAFAPSRRIRTNGFIMRDPPPRKEGAAGFPY